MSYEDRVTVYLAIESVELGPAVLTEQVGVHADRQWVVGESRGRTGKIWERNGWIIETTVRSEEHGGQSASWLVPIALNAFHEKVAPHSKAISVLGASVERYVVLSILAEEFPGIELNHSFLQLLADLGGTFQIDAIISGPDSALAAR